MSIHLLEAAALLDLPPAKKLILMAFADAADKHTRVAAPGLENVQQWASVGRSRVLELTAELVADGLLVRRRAGHRGRRAEYVVLPGGCCPEHDPIQPPDTDEKGSSEPDPTPVDNPPERVRPSGPNSGKGSGKGPVATGPLPSYQEQPPHPPTPDGAGGVCPRHGPNTAANCRGCGTTVRQLTAAGKAARARAALAAEQAAAAERRQARARASPPPPDVLAVARASIQQAQRSA